MPAIFQINVNISAPTSMTSVSNGAGKDCLLLISIGANASTAEGILTGGASGALAYAGANYGSNSISIYFPGSVTTMYMALAAIRPYSTYARVSAKAVTVGSVTSFSVSIGLANTSNSYKYIPNGVIGYFYNACTTPSSLYSYGTYYNNGSTKYLKASEKSSYSDKFVFSINGTNRLLPLSSFSINNSFNHSYILVPRTLYWTGTTIYVTNNHTAAITLTDFGLSANTTSGTVSIQKLGSSVSIAAGASNQAVTISHPASSYIYNTNGVSVKISWNVPYGYTGTFWVNDSQYVISGTSAGSSGLYTGSQILTADTNGGTWYLTFGAMPYTLSISSLNNVTLNNQTSYDFYAMYLQMYIVYNGISSEMLSLSTNPQAVTRGSSVNLSFKKTKTSATGTYINVHVDGYFLSQISGYLQAEITMAGTLIGRVKNISTTSSSISFATDDYRMTSNMSPSGALTIRLYTTTSPQ